MNRTEATKDTALRAEAITFERKLRDIETARNAGHLVLECGPSALDGHQILALNPADESDTNFWFDWQEPHSIEGTDTQYRISTGHLSGIRYEGVTRRQGLLRRYAQLDITIDEMSIGDRVTLRVGDECFSSQPIREISAEPDLAVAKSQLHIPRLALSAE